MAITRCTEAMKSDVKTRHLPLIVSILDHILTATELSKTRSLLATTQMAVTTAATPVTQPEHSIMRAFGQKLA